MVFRGRQGGGNRVLTHSPIVVLALLVQPHSKAQLLVCEFHEAVVEPAESLLVDAFVTDIGRRIAVPA